MSSKTPKRHLVSAAYAPSTLTRYNDAVSHFLSWCHTNDLDPSSPESFDDILTDYFHHLYDTNQGKGAAHNTLYGILMYLPHLKHHLHLASKSLVGWNKLYPPKSYPPLTWELCCLVAVRLAMDGHLLHAVATLLGFDCFLRIGELVGLRRDDVADVKDTRMGGVSADMTLRLRSTKTGPNQWVVVENAAVKTLLRRTPSLGTSSFPSLLLLFATTSRQPVHLWASAPPTSPTLFATVEPRVTIFLAATWRTFCCGVVGHRPSLRVVTSKPDVPCS
jgi:hypothetical protein